MTILTKAIEFDYAYTTQSEPPVSVYKRPSMDPQWAIGSVPQGGYSLTCLIEACTVHQKNTNHPHPASVSAQYLVANTCEPKTRINVKVIKKGRQFTNLLAEMVQHGKVTISAQLIFTSIPAVKLPTNPKLSLLPPSSQARFTPALQPPSALKPTPLGSKLSPFDENMAWCEDPSFKALNESKRNQPSKRHEGGLEWGAYLELKKGDPWKSSMMGFFGDLFKNAPELMAGSEGLWWYPTMSIHLQYLSRVDEKDEKYSKTKVFLYANGSFLEEGRHDCTVEVWTAPASNRENGNWREEQVCLARCTQFAWALPLSVNQSRAKKAKL